MCVKGGLNADYVYSKFLPMSGIEHFTSHLFAFKVVVIAGVLSDDISLFLTAEICGLTTEVQVW